MFGRYWDMSSMINAMTLLFMITVIMFIIINHDKINIDLDFSNDYLQEYNECQGTLERTQPICPAVTCQDNSSWKMIWAFIIGLILMFVLYDGIFFPRLMKSRLEKFAKTSVSEGGNKDGRK